MKILTLNRFQQIDNKFAGSNLNAKMQKLVLRKDKIKEEIN